MKLLSIAVPSYNSQDYLHRCLDTLVTGGSEVEIIIVDDGSTDDTAAVAHKYQEEYPDIVRVISKENGGHGSAVNSGLAAANGQYFKVVDSDDWLNQEAYLAVLKCLREQNEPLDLLITNYVYEYFYNGTSHTVHYRNVFPQQQLFGWEHARKFRVSQLLLMHSMIYRTELLRDCGLNLPEHTFYVDNVVAYQPLPYVKKMLYLDVDFYRYFIGRPDQSVNTVNMIKRIDQQIRVTNILIKSYHLEEGITDKPLRRYMYRYLSMMVAICLVHLILSKEQQNLDKIPVLWANIRNFDQAMYKRIRRSQINRAASLPGRSGRMVARTGFYIAKRIFKFS